MRCYLGAVLHVLGVEECVVDPEHNPVKQGAVQRLGHGIPHGHSLKRKRTKGDWKLFLFCTKMAFVSQAPTSSVCISPLPKLSSAILISAVYANGPESAGNWVNPRAVPLTLAFMHSSG